MIKVYLNPPLQLSVLLVRMYWIQCDDGLKGLSRMSGLHVSTQHSNVGLFLVLALFMYTILYGCSIYLVNKDWLPLLIFYMIIFTCSIAKYMKGWKKQSNITIPSPEEEMTVKGMPSAAP